MQPEKLKGMLKQLNKMIGESKGTPMRLTVFNTHTLRTRETILTPSDTWGGSGLLGITIRFDVTTDIDRHTLHRAKTSVNRGSTGRDGPGLRQRAPRVSKAPSGRPATLASKVCVVSSQAARR